MNFRWIDWNHEHIGEHGVVWHEAEEVVERARNPWPLAREDDRWLVWGQTHAGRWLQVVYLMDPDGTLFVIHARPLTEREKTSYRRTRRRHT